MAEKDKSAESRRRNAPIQSENYTWDLAIVGARPDEFSHAVKLKK
jgi:hypothetical protein